MIHERQELPLPKSTRPSIFWSTFSVFFYVGSPLLAFDNVRHWNGGFDLIAGVSLFWLVLMVLSWLVVAPEVPTMVRNFLGSFSNDHFFAVESDGYVSSGFRIFGEEVLHFGVPMMLITNVETHAGQASSLAGEDMDDWQIFVRESSDLHVIGPDQQRKSAELQIEAMHTMLRKVGWTPGI